jgi:hypothetical protein
MLLKKGPQQVLRILLSAQLCQIADMMTGMMSKECPVGRGLIIG